MPSAFSRITSADGTFGNSGRAPFRQPGRHQWDVTLSKNFYPTDKVRMQFRADFINAFNQRQFRRTRLVDLAGCGVDHVLHVLETLEDSHCDVLL